MASVAVCLYSKYSQRCKEFLDDLPGNMGVQMLCIDNKDVRKAIMQDKNGYHIKTVPCIFLFYSNGRLEKFEGSDAFVWLRKQLDKDGEDDEEEEPPRPVKSVAKPPVARKPRQQQVSVSADILEIGREDSPSGREIMETSPIQLPSGSEKEEEEIFFSREDTGNAAQSTEEMMENEISMRRASEQIITRKQDNIKELAQAMQRQREVEEERMNPPPPGAPGTNVSSSSGTTRI